MKIKILLLLSAALGIFFSFKPTGNEEATQLLQQVVTAVSENHVEAKPLDDDLSKEMFANYLSRLDPQKEFFTQVEINRLEGFQLALDDALQQGNFDFFDQSFTYLHEGLDKAKHFYQTALEQSVDWSQVENLETDADKLDYAKDDVALENRWRKKVKKYLLDELLMEGKETNASTVEAINLKAKEQIEYLLEKKFAILQKKSKEEYLDDYVNAFLKCHDFQTEYLSPVKKAQWEEEFTRSYVGIGARLDMENGYPRIAGLTIGGAAWNSKQLMVGDVILKIRNTDQSPVSTFGLDMQEVVKLLKGDKGTEVHLTIKKATAEEEEVVMQRTEIVDDLAMSFILEDQKRKQKIGYLRLPRFYAGAEGCAVHVQKELDLLKGNGAEGIVFDLRNNKGGSSREVVEIVGYFLKQGLVMQAEYADGTLLEREDTDGVARYRDDLVILVNADSGSGSELMAGTLQDYQRACIVGSPATFGKGSMQRFFDMDIDEENKIKNLGTIKMTVGRFFTAAGRSPQYEGIQPDIILPDDYLLVESGERRFANALPAKNLTKTEVSQDVNLLSDLEAIKEQSKNRVKTSDRFQLAEAKAKRIKAKENDTIWSLQLEAQATKKKQDAVEEAMFENIFREIDNFKVYIPSDQALVQDSISRLKKESWLKKIQSDPYIHEAYWIVNDLIG